ncbi:hypothetical protein C8R45DRAFT_935025 [Mycena sanguinolenta]|nr:hypothetical protein C8R45DRAFT_935025 [Mycena sanguinolenta]
MDLASSRVLNIDIDGLDVLLFTGICTPPASSIESVFLLREPSSNKSESRIWALDFSSSSPSSSSVKGEKGTPYIELADINSARDKIRLLLTVPGVAAVQRIRVNRRMATYVEMVKTFCVPYGDGYDFRTLPMLGSAIRSENFSSMCKSPQLSALASWYIAQDEQSSSPTHIPGSLIADQTWAHSYPLTEAQRYDLAQRITTIHTTVFTVPAAFWFANYAATDHYIGEKRMGNVNLILANVRTGPSRTHAVFESPCRQISSN